MRIAVFASSVHPHLGGVEELTLRLAQQYQAQGHEVVVLTNRWPRDLAPFERHEGVEIHRFAFRRPITSERSVAALKSVATYLLTARQVRRRIAALLRSWGAEVVHVQCVSSNALYAMYAAGDLGVPLVVTAQGELTMDAGRMYQRDPGARRLLEAVTARAAVVTGCSSRTLADVEAYLGHGFGARGRVIFNGTEVGRFRSAEPHALGGRYVFALGRLVEQKGLDVLIRAFAASAPADVALVIAGEGPSRTVLEALAGELGVADRVRLVGRADRPQVASYMAGAAAIAVPSVADEGFPLVGVEAMASGRPLVITDTGGVRDVMVSEETALIVPKGDAVALGAALARVLGDADLAARLGAAAQAAAAERLDWSVLATEYLAVFAEVTRPLVSR